ncbi:MAG: IS1595 family transposase [Oceanospirillaceae bacterium]|nr:IS1595 family transposase [Oceanospirillaceae bacterium]
MHKQELLDFIRKISEMDRSQRMLVADGLAKAEQSQAVFDIIESRFEELGCCPHCGAGQFHKHGFANSLQRYRCLDCRKTFNALTGTPLARLRKRESWLEFLATLMQSLSVRDAARRLNVNSKTAFLWRHRFLEWISEDKAQNLSGITEADETFFLYSEKGKKKLDRPPRMRGGRARKRGLSKEQVCVLVARDRHDATADFITGMGPVSAEGLRENLLPLLDKDALLVSDTNNAYLKFSRDAGITFHRINTSQKKRVEGAFHVQNVNAYHSRLKEWIRRFHGVATKYLHHYLGWRRALETYREMSPRLLLSRALMQLPHSTGT